MLEPVDSLVARNSVRQPGESASYRDARTKLLQQEIELRRLRESVAVQRRTLSPGPVIDDRYRFADSAGETDLNGLFGGYDTLAIYDWMFAPQGGRIRPCPMCTTLLDSWDGNVRSMQRTLAVAVVGRGVLADMLAFKVERGWQHLPLYADLDGAWSRDAQAVTADDMDIPAFSILTRKRGEIRLFWREEMALADPGQDPRGHLDQMPLWMMLDATPEGRPAGWYPTLDD